jgi:S-adenosylmethionine decarboxylase proenzyme
MKSNSSSPKNISIPFPAAGVGFHTIYDLYNCEPSALDDLTLLEKMMLEASEKAGAKIIDIQSKHFEPYGVSSIVILAESHLSLHTWPEHNFAALDLFTCTPKIDAMIAKGVLTTYLTPQRVDIKSFRRGRSINLPRQH